MYARVERLYERTLTGLRFVFFGYLDTQFGKLCGSQILRRFHDGSLAAARHREGLHFAQMRFSCEIHDEPLDAERDASVRRYAESECSEHVSDALLYLFLAVPHHFIGGFQNFGLVCADATAARLVAVADQVILRRQYLAEVFLREELFHVLGHGH